MKKDENVFEAEVIDEVISDKAIASKIEAEVELTDEEKRLMLVEELKKYNKLKSKFRPVRQVGNVTTNDYGVAYKKKRQKKNKLQRKSRTANR